jgi:hypothetical protein
MRPSAILLLALALAFPAGADKAPKDPLAGAWSGTGKFTSSGASPACTWAGSYEPPAVKLDLQRSADALTGTVTIDIAAPSEACADLKLSSPISEVAATGSTLSFKDQAGRSWNLGLKLGRLQGLVSSEDQSGEVSFGRVVEGAGKGGGGMMSGTLGIIGANVIGIGALVGINAVAKEKSTDEGGIVANCSPRVCTVQGPGEPCDCNGNIIAGGQCGETTAGQAVGQVCDPVNQPCQANLSCNNAVCEDRFGRCPF